MIEVSGLSKQFGFLPIISDVRFCVKEKDSYVILGQSGSGKSVLLKILAGLIIPDHGHVSMGTSNVGMIFQQNALFDSLNVFENLAFPLKEKKRITGKDATVKIEKFLEWVGLPGTEKLFPNELSGGMQKRLGIARALIVEPEVVLYDEPTAGLDPITSRMIADLIIRLKKEMGSTVIAVTSDVMRGFQLADELGILMKSKTGSHLKNVGSPTEAKNSTDEATRQFIKGLKEGPLTTEDVPETHRHHHGLSSFYLGMEDDPF